MVPLLGTEKDTSLLTAAGSGSEVAGKQYHRSDLKTSWIDGTSKTQTSLHSVDPTFDPKSEPQYGLVRGLQRVVSNQRGLSLRPIDPGGSLLPLLITVSTFIPDRIRMDPGLT